MLMCAASMDSFRIANSVLNTIMRANPDNATAFERNPRLMEAVIMAITSMPAPPQLRGDDSGDALSSDSETGPLSRNDQISMLTNADVHDYLVKCARVAMQTRLEQCLSLSTFASLHRFAL